MQQELDACEILPRSGFRYQKKSARRIAQVSLREPKGCGFEPTD
jgi:hypothetical protein